MDHTFRSTSDHTLEVVITSNICQTATSHVCWGINQCQVETLHIYVGLHCGAPCCRDGHFALSVFSSTPTCILNLTISSESQWKVRKYCQLFTRVEYISRRTIHHSSHSNERRCKCWIIVAKATSSNSDRTIRQYAHGLLLENPFVPSSIDHGAVRAKIRQKRPPRWP